MQKTNSNLLSLKRFSANKHFFKFYFVSIAVGISDLKKCLTESLEQKQKYFESCLCLEFAGGSVNIF